MKVSEILWILLPAASGGLLITIITMRTRTIHAKGWLLFTTLVALAEAVLCVFAWRDSMGVEEPLQSAIPFTVGFTCAFLVGLAVFFSRSRSIVFRGVAAASATVLTTACSPFFTLFLGCAFGPCI
jgi:hypothetical protein